MEDNVSRLLDEGSEASASSRRAGAAAVPNSAGKGLLGDGASLSQGLQRSVSGGSGASPGRQSTAGGPPIRKYTCRFDIGIENDREFQVARRIIGQKGANMKKIVGMSNAKLRLRGQGSGYLEGAARVESPDPLHLCISCLTKEGYDKAVAETAKLLKKVYSDWRDFNVKKHRGDPGFLELQMKEQFLVGGQGGPDGGNHHNNNHHYNGGNYRSSGGGRGGGSWGRSKENSSITLTRCRGCPRLLHYSIAFSTLITFCIFGGTLGFHNHFITSPVVAHVYLQLLLLLLLRCSCVQIPCVICPLY